MKMAHIANIALHLSMRTIVSMLSVFIFMEIIYRIAVLWLISAVLALILFLLVALIHKSTITISDKCSTSQSDSSPYPDYELGNNIISRWLRKLVCKTPTHPITISAKNINNIQNQQNRPADNSFHTSNSTRGTLLLSLGLVGILLDITNKIDYLLFIDLLSTQIKATNKNDKGDNA